MLFDLEADPGELRNLFAEDPEEVQRLKKLLGAWEMETEPAR